MPPNKIRLHDPNRSYLQRSPIKRSFVNVSGFGWLHFRYKLECIRSQWMPLRLIEHGVCMSSAEVRTFLNLSQQITTQYMADIQTLLNIAVIQPQLPRSSRKVIFEGAQGLMLDEGRTDQWPHVTRSKTGLTNVIRLAHELQLDNLIVTYVTRSYLTRHGAGPLPGECAWTFPDSTNVTNLFQGSLRFAPLDTRQLNGSITSDLSAARAQWPNIQANLAMTWLDHLSPPNSDQLCLPLQYLSFGACRLDVSHTFEKWLSSTNSNSTSGARI